MVSFRYGVRPCQAQRTDGAHTMRIDIEGEDLIRAAGDPAAKRIIRSAAYFLLAAIGDIPEETDAVVPTGTSGDHRPGAMPAPFVPAAATAAVAPVVTGVADAAPKTVPTASVPPPPPPPPAPIIGKGDDPTPSSWISETLELIKKERGEYVVTACTPGMSEADEGTNTGNVPPPPPGVANTAGVATQSTPTAPGAAGVAAPSGVVSAPSHEVDAAGLPWDERIHQKGKSKKKDNTWKLKKGIDLALVQSVTAELAARRAASPAPTAGSLPLTSTSTGSNTVPVPPVPNVAPVGGVPAPNGNGASVPVPPPPAVGGVGSSDSPYRKLIDKITDLTKAGKLTPAKVSEICTSHGSPSLMALKQFEALIPAVDKDIDAAALGLM